MNVTLSCITIFVGILVAYVSHLQHKLARDRFRLDLFEKRFAVYKGVQKFLSHILITASLKDLTPLFTFRIETQDSCFLFGNEIADYINSIDKKALKMRAYASKYENLKIGEERTKLVEQESELMGELIDELGKLKNIFGPYLKFGRRG